MSMAGGMRTTMAVVQPAPSRPDAGHVPDDAPAEEAYDGGDAQVEEAALSPGALLERLRAHALGAPLPERASEAAGHREVLARAGAALARIDAQPERIPRRPQLLPALMRATGSGDASIHAIAALVQQDPTLTGNVLRVANSAYYRVGGQPLESVERAIARLGTEGMRRIVAATLMQPVLDGRRVAFADFAPVAWSHSLVAAEAAFEYAGGAHRDPGSTAHMAALVHGLGGIVVVQVVREEYARQPSLAPDPAVPIALLDRAGATAARIAASWELPAALVDALSGTGDDDEGATPLARALRFGRLAAAAVVLVRAGLVEDTVALASVERFDGYDRDRSRTVMRGLLERATEPAE